MNVVSIEKCDIPVGLNIGEQLRQVQVNHIKFLSWSHKKYMFNKVVGLR